MICIIKNILHKYIYRHNVVDDERKDADWKSENVEERQWGEGFVGGQHTPGHNECGKRY